MAPDAEELTSDVINIDAYETPTTEDVLFEGIDYGYDVPDISLNGSTFTFGNENPTDFTGSTSAQPLGDFSSNPFNGELIDLGGVFEALPPFEIMEDL